MSSENRVLIAGAGPVGMITGYFLARNGVPVTVFESRPGVIPDHRASTVHPSTLDMLAELGMTETMIARGLKSPTFQYRDRYDDRIVAEFDYGLIHDQTNHPFALQIEQHKVVGIAYELARDLPDFDILWSHEVRDINQDADGVEVVVKTPAGETESWRGRYLIAADGGRSVIRKALDIDFPGFTWEERFIIATTNFDFGRPEAGAHHYRNYIAHPERWCALIKIAGDDMSGKWRFLVPAKNDEADDHVQTEQWVQERFSECLPYAAPYEIVHLAFHAVNQRVAETFHRGRVMLAGDSAHVNNPLGGMGMNGGIHDGLNIAAKLCEIWRGEGDVSLLGRYDRQRRTMARKYVQAQSISNKELLQETDMNKRRERLDGLAAIAEDKAKCHRYLLNSSLIAMVREANSVT